MRVMACVIVLSSWVVACGGKTPPPKDADEAVASSGSKSDDVSAPSGGGDDAGGGPAAPADSAATSAPPPKADTSGNDLKAAATADDPWLAAHQMPGGDVLKTVRPAQGKVQACFKAGLKRDGSTNGEVKIKFVITNAGAVRVWKDNGSSMTDEEVTKCVGDLVQTLKFPKQKSPGDAWGTYAINFTP